MNTFDKQHYIDQMQYICQCIMDDIAHNLMEIIVDNFAGGGGASTGIEMATGYSVFAAINHDPEAIRMHMANHPSTRHYCESVWDVDPLVACEGKPVGLAWFSPDCKHFSKAKGGKPKDKTIRGLAWVALRWAGTVRPRVIMLENVEEFKTWGPLNRSHRPIKAKQGFTFHQFISQLQELGYQVEFNELVAADYGTPTMRKRFFMIARCDGQPIVWPEPTHAPRESMAVKTGMLEPYIGAHTQIDFTRPCPSIFDSAEEIKAKYGIRAQRPLAPKTMQRIYRGLQKFVIDNQEPFIVQCNHGGERRPQDIREPMPTITGKHMLMTPTLIQCKYDNFPKGIDKPLGTITTVGSHLLVAPTLIQYHSETAGGEVRGQGLTDPIMTVDGSNRYGLVSAFIQQYYDGNYKGSGKTPAEPLPTITAVDHNSVCAVNIVQLNNNCDGIDITKPIPTITAGGGHFGEVRSFLTKYYGQDAGIANDRAGLVTIHGVDYAIVDIGLRMLEPKELYGCQGFPADYIIDRDHTGKAYPRSEQVKRCGNAVCPPIPAALVRVNLPELCKGERMPNMRVDQEPQGQMRFA